MAQQEKGQIQIFAKTIRGNSSGVILEESKYIRNIAGGKHVQNGTAGGVNNNLNQTRTSTEETRVQSIECLDELDDGSANDGSGTNQQKGVVFNKTYRFKVKEYSKGEPRNLNSVKWLLSYTNPDNGQYTENILVNQNATGNQISINFSTNGFCGRNLEVKAYIADKELEGKLLIFMHNRFRWFDGKIIEDELNIRVGSKMPWVINQSGTSLCGMACIFYLFAKEQPAQYKWFSELLFRTGEATYNQFTAKPTDELLDKNPNERGFPQHWDLRLRKFTHMTLVDFVTLAGVRNTDNNSYKGGEEEFQAINWPPLMTSLSEKLLGYGDVVSNGIYNPIKKSKYFHKPTAWKIIEDINQQISDGYKITLMIDSDLISPDEDICGICLNWNITGLCWKHQFHPSRIWTVKGRFSTR
ncbi:hypothetical protein MVI27_11645 [Chryseobacterium salipaludis]|uniref:hypothetical protein n=1 Tax=Chryseobacterium TaxID=59732 RepID=UPI001FF6F887|nr:MULTISPECIES: hypothetical protein [Chryseobacterium]MCJ8498903.1 hypothetical protein [Chryseobacterium salipaludis]MCX3295572.1 hypothetical protein [Planobacterium sp. JC490]